MYIHNGSSTLNKSFGYYVIPRIRIMVIEVTLGKDTCTCYILIVKYVLIQLINYLITNPFIIICKHKQSYL